MKEAISALMASRKSIVGFGAIVLIGLVYFFGEGDVATRVTAMGAIATIAATIIHAIGQEDAAAKANGTGGAP